MRRFLHYIHRFPWVPRVPCSVSVHLSLYSSCALIATCTWWQRVIRLPFSRFTYCRMFSKCSIQECPAAVDAGLRGKLIRGWIMRCLSPPCVRFQKVSLLCFLLHQIEGSPSLLPNICSKVTRARVSVMRLFSLAACQLWLAFCFQNIKVVCCHS